MTVVPFPKPAASPDPAPCRKREPKGFLLVPRRILDVLARLEASVDAFAADHGNTGVMIDWNAYYQVIAILELAPRYEQ
jgi:hypothetical protein